MSELAPVLEGQLNKWSLVNPVLLATTFWLAIMLAFQHSLLRESTVLFVKLSNANLVKLKLYFLLQSFLFSKFKIVGPHKCFHFKKIVLRI